MTSFEQKFQAELARLNPDQRTAVDTLEGPVMVFAGPGTGKTQILTLRLANIIHQGLAEPAQILALTFTTAAAGNMRARLGKMIGHAGLGVSFFTFHEFCQTIISEHPEAFPFGEHAQPLSDLERLELFQTIIDEVMPPTMRRPGAPYHYLEAMATAIQNLKQEYITPQRYRELVNQEKERIDQLISAEMTRKRPRKGMLATWRTQLAKQTELADLYDCYTQKMRQRQRYDYADMILETVQVFQNQPDILAQVQEQFQYILVDEYQDTNNAQNTILDLLGSFWGEQANIFVVGDPFQSIYRFQGANLENFLSFADRYPAATVINLQTGYRCHDRTYALAYALTTQMSPLEGHWQPTQALRHCRQLAGTPALLTESATQTGEIINIFTRIRQLLDQGVPPEDIAIIYRKNRDSGPLMNAANHYGIPFEIEGGIDVLETNLCHWIEQICQFCHELPSHSRADHLIYQLLWLPFWDLDELAVVTLSRVCSGARLSLTAVFLDPNHEAWANLASQGVKKAEIDKLWDISHRLKKLAKTGQINKPTEFFAHLLEDLGVISWARRQSDYLIQLTIAYTLSQAITSWQNANPGLTLEGLLANFALMREHHLSLPLQDLDVRQGAIALTTAHRAKGREWPYVFIYGLQKGVWDHARASLSLKLPPGIITHQVQDDKQATLDEEKRLFYVAITRASQQNFLSWHLTEDEGTTTRKKQPSDLVYFLQEQQDASLVQTAPELLDTAQMTAELATLIAPPPARKWSADTRRYLQKRVSELTLSATMLNDYLADTDTFIARHLLHAPSDVGSLPQIFGTCVHRVLEQAFRPVLAGKQLMPLDQAQSRLAQELAYQQLEERDQKVWTTLGQQSLAAYYHFYETHPGKPLALERNFGTLPALTLGEVRLTGKIDRIDALDGDQAMVIDYKTGRHLTMGQLLGTTADAQLSQRERALPEPIRSQYKRQLLFYKLLCDLEPSFTKEVTTGALHFVKSDDEKITIREFALPDEELDLLKDLIQQVWQEIQTLAFLPPETETVV